MATGGTVELTAVPTAVGETVTVSGSNITFAPVEVEAGCTSAISSFSFSGATQDPGAKAPLKRAKR